VDANGNPQWGDTCGVAICTAPGIQEFLQIVSDGVGGAIITWWDARDEDYIVGGDIYAQRVDSGGHVLWDTNGVVICDTTGSQKFPQVISDGEGGAIIAWWDTRSDGGDIYAERVDNNGTLLWGDTCGVAICIAPGYQVLEEEATQITADDTGGAIITWTDERLGPFAQRIDADGSIHPGWPVDGAAICTKTADHCTITSDGGGGAIIAWRDFRVPFGQDVYAQKVDAEGNVPWPWREQPNGDDGVPVCAVTGDQVLPRIIESGDGGAIIVWMDDRGPGADYDLVAQKLNPHGFIFTGISSRVTPHSAPIRSYPNPFNPTTTIVYSLPSSGRVSLRIYDVHGHLVKTLVNERKDDGQHRITWNGRDASGTPVASGIYFVRLESGGLVQTQKIALLK
jgi:hypothetical protein